MALATADPTDGEAVGFAALYARQPKHPVTACNLCGGSGFVQVTAVDRHGIPVSTSRCVGCDLVFLDSLMTDSGYAAFYADHRRAMMRQHQGPRQRRLRRQSAAAEQKTAAQVAAALLGPRLQANATVLDAGSATDAVARELAALLPVRVGFAGLPRGVRFDLRDRLAGQGVGLLDTGHRVEPGSVDAIVIPGVLDHFRDLAAVFRDIRAVLRPGGLLLFDVIDFARACAAEPPVSRHIKLDHLYYLTERTALAYLDRSGFTTLAVTPRSKRHRFDILARST